MGSRRSGVVLAVGAGLGLALLSMVRGGEPVRKPVSVRDVSAEAAKKPVETKKRVEQASRKRRVAAERESVRIKRGPSEEIEELPQRPAAKVVDVVDADGRPVDSWLRPVDCPGYQPDGQGGFVSDEGEPCTVQAIRKDGMLSIPSEPITVDDAEGYGQIEVPSGRMGGIGVSFRKKGDSVVVLNVIEGTPAWAAGLEAGDRILTVDGESVGNFDRWEFVRRMTGPEGSEVAFEVEYQEGGEPVVEEVLAEREVIEG